MTDANKTQPDSALPLATAERLFRRICSLCGKNLDSKKKEQPPGKPSLPFPSSAISHGLCPACARTLYPEFFARHPDFHLE